MARQQLKGNSTVGFRCMNRVQVYLRRQRVVSRRPKEALDKDAGQLLTPLLPQQVQHDIRKMSGANNRLRHS